MAYIPLGGPGNCLTHRKLEAIPGFRQAAGALRRLGHQEILVELRFLIKVGYSPKSASDTLHYVLKRVRHLCTFLEKDEVALPENFYEEVLRLARVQHVKEVLADYRRNPMYTKSDGNDPLNKVYVQYLQRFGISFEEIGITEAQWESLKRKGAVAYIKRYLIKTMLRDLRPTSPNVRRAKELIELMRLHTLTFNDVGVKWAHGRMFRAWANEP